MKREPSVEKIRREYARLCESLSRTELICQGTIKERMIRRPVGRRAGRSKQYGPYYQWTRKVAGKTVTVNLASDQAKHYARAILENQRLEAVVAEMRRISLKILDLTTVGVRRRRRVK